MVIANEEVAKWSIERKLPFLYRTHDKPTDEGVKRLRDTFEAFGITFAIAPGQKLTPKDVQRSVEALRSKDPDGYATK